MAPALFAVVVGFALPLISAAQTSMYTVEGQPRESRFVGLDNYVQVAESGELIRVLIATVTYAVISVVGTMILGLGAALMINRPIGGRGFFRSALLIPYAVPIVVWALVWRWMFDVDYGIINHLLKGIGVIDSGITWFGSESLAMAAVIFIGVIREAPIAMIIFLGALQLIDENLYEAAKIDGANRWASFTHVTLPGLRTVVTVLTVLLGTSFLGRAITVILLTTGGGPNSATEILSLKVYDAVAHQADFNLSATWGIITVLFTAVLVIPFVLSRREAKS